MSKREFENIIYLQCDARYNEWLLKKIDDKCVVEYTIEKCKLLGCKKIIAAMCKCDENEQLIDILELNGVEVRLSTEEDVNKRFLNCILNQNEEYCIRVGGDQLLIDCEETRRVLYEMEEQNKEFFLKNISIVFCQILLVSNV